MKQNKLYKAELKALSHIGAFINKIPDCIVYGALTILTYFVILIY